MTYESVRENLAVGCSSRSTHVLKRKPEPRSSHQRDTVVFVYIGIYASTTYRGKMNHARRPTTRQLINLMAKKWKNDMKKCRDNDRIDIVKAKGFEGEVKVIAERLYADKYERLPVFRNGIKSWVNFYVKTDLPILMAAYSEFGSNAFRDYLDEKRHEKWAERNWAMKRIRNLEGKREKERTARERERCMQLEREGLFLCKGQGSKLA
jgi:hypothetical protein